MSRARRTTALAVPTQPAAPLAVRPPAVLTEAARRLLAGWLEGKSEDTRRSYFASATHFAKWLVEHGHARTGGHAWDVITRALQVDEDEGNLLVASWIASQAGMSRGGIATRCSGVHRLCRKLKATRQIGYIPEFDRPRASRMSPRERAQKYEGVAAAFDAIAAGLERVVASSSATVIDVRDWAIVRQLSAMGLRRIELVGPRGQELDDVDFDRGAIAIRGKGRDRKEWLRMPPALAPVLRRWLRVRAKIARPGCKAFYIALGRGMGGPIRQRGTLNEMLVRRGEQFGVELTPHDLRRIQCTEALRQYGPQKAIEITRHADVSTVQLYDLEQGRQADEMADSVGNAVMRRGKTQPKNRRGSKRGKGKRAK